MHNYLVRVRVFFLSFFSLREEETVRRDTRVTRESEHVTRAVIGQVQGDTRVCTASVVRSGYPRPRAGP